jgi:hypothetical protein
LFFDILRNIKKLIGIIGNGNIGYPDSVYEPN